MKLINLTPHSITLIIGDNTVSIPASGQLARVSQVTEQLGVAELELADGTLITVPVSRNTYGQVDGLPEQDDETKYIVSALVKSACPNRIDLLVPNESVRDEAGRIVGCRSLGC